MTRQGEYIENQNFTRQENDQSVAKLFLAVSRADNHVQYSCEASNGDHFPSVSQKTNFSVNDDPPSCIRTKVFARALMWCRTRAKH